MTKIILSVFFFYFNNKTFLISETRKKCEDYWDSKSLKLIKT